MCMNPEPKGSIRSETKEKRVSLSQRGVYRRKERCYTEGEGCGRAVLYFGNFCGGSSIAVLWMLGLGVGVVSVSRVELRSTGLSSLLELSSEESGVRTSRCEMRLRSKRARSNGACWVIGGTSPDGGRELVSEARVEIEDVRTRLKGDLNMRCCAYATGGLGDRR